jgi:uncharacterized protein YcbK (DUF882 family)
MDWGAYPNFRSAEFRCRHCGREEMKPEFMALLQRLRTEFGPMVISSGWRCRDHPVEKDKASPGMHPTGMAADVAVHGADAVRLLRLALALGFTGIGIQQKGAGRFVHLDLRVVPTIWSY